MVKLGIEQIAEIIKPCGLSATKSKNIFNLSKILVEKYNGEVPRTFEELEALPGVGHKTASVMMIHAFKVPAFPVDTHIHRLAKTSRKFSLKANGKSATCKSSCSGALTARLSDTNPKIALSAVKSNRYFAGKTSSRTGSRRPTARKATFLHIPLYKRHLQSYRISATDLFQTR